MNERAKIKSPRDASFDVAQIASDLSVALPSTTVVATVGVDRIEDIMLTKSSNGTRSTTSNRHRIASRSRQHAGLTAGIPSAKNAGAGTASPEAGNA